ncbi:MAG: hypothetical protein FWG87_15170 [Defluviitaleaceae bacterium]|nr:hypothetical protein [Defluviitaleaceae bacterium]
MFIVGTFQKIWVGLKGKERGFSRIWRIFADSFLRVLKTNVLLVFLLCLAPSVPLCLCASV